VDFFSQDMITVLLSKAIVLQGFNNPYSFPYELVRESMIGEYVTPPCILLYSPELSVSQLQASDRRIHYGRL
jgi:hypothetical protein